MVTYKSTMLSNLRSTLSELHKPFSPVKPCRLITSEKAPGVS